MFWAWLVFGVSLPVVAFAYGVSVVLRGDPAWRPLGLTVVWTSWMVLAAVTWLTGFSIGLFILPLTIVTFGIAVAATVRTREMETRESR